MYPIKLLLGLFLFSTVHLSACQHTGEARLERSGLDRTSLDSTGTFLSQPELRTRLLVYADSVGVDTATLQVPAGLDSTLALLYEIRYGHQPAHLKYLGLTEQLDTLALLRARKQLHSQAFKEVVPEPTSAPYQQLKFHYQRLRRVGPPDSLVALRETLNLYRWMSRFPGSTYALVSIPAAELVVLSDTGEVLRMRVIVGSPRHQTPSFATYCSALITYPYWNVPRSIAVGEMLPRIKKNPGYLDSQNLQVLSPDGRVVDPATVDWAALDAKNFPYRLRQSTGCDNALGLIKFDLESPYAIYLHDTNARSLFAREARWLSHGCIRLQRPVELANLMLEEKRMDEDFLNRCRINATPASFRLPQPFAVFILYPRVDLDSHGNLRWLPNIYRWPFPEP